MSVKAEKNTATKEHERPAYAKATAGTHEKGEESEAVSSPVSAAGKGDGFGRRVGFLEFIYVQFQLLNLYFRIFKLARQNRIIRKKNDLLRLKVNDSLLCVSKLRREYVAQVNLLEQAEESGHSKHLNLLGDAKETSGCGMFNQVKKEVAI